VLLRFLPVSTALPGVSCCFFAVGIRCTESAKACVFVVQNKSKEASSREAEASPFNAFNLFGGAKDKLPRDVGMIGGVFFFGMLVFYVFHCCWVSAEMYSAPSIVLQSRSPQGGVHVFDDFREAYGWLRHNTDEEAKVSSV